MSLLVRNRNVLHWGINSTSAWLCNKNIMPHPPQYSGYKGFRQDESSLEKERALMLKDKIPPGYMLIYRAPMETYVAAVKNVSTLTAALISFMVAYTVISSKFPSAVNFNELEMMGLVSQQNDLLYFVTGFGMITLVIHIFVAKYTLRIYKNTDKYIAVYNSQLPLGTSRHHFCVGDVSEVRSVINPWNGSTYRLGSRTSLLLNKYFKTPAEFNKMLGYE